MEVLVHDESIGDADIKGKVKKVLIELPTLSAAVVVPSYLISTINSTHVFVVGDDRLRAGYRQR